MARKRMILSIDEELHQVLMDIADATGQPAASFVASFLEDLRPQLVTIRDMVSKAKAGAISEAHDILEQMAQTSQDQLDEFHSQVDDVNPRKKEKGDNEQT